MTATSPPHHPPPRPARWSPHAAAPAAARVLAVAAAGGVVAIAGRTSAVGSESLPAWSDPATWGTAGVPRPGSVVVVDFPVRLDRDIDVAGLHVECGGHLVLDPQKSVTIRTTGNVEVCGLLEMRPARAEVQHLLRFEGIDERRFVGGGMSVLASDVGLWIHEDGQLDLHGTPRTAWVRAAGALSPGDRTIRLAAQPTGWRVGDELTITPTGTPVDKSHAVRFDQATITSISRLRGDALVGAALRAPAGRRRRRPRAHRRGPEPHAQRPHRGDPRGPDPHHGPDGQPALAGPVRRLPALRPPTGRRRLHDQGARPLRPPLPHVPGRQPRLGHRGRRDA